jgi:hypothetical protein
MIAPIKSYLVEITNSIYAQVVLLKVVVVKIVSDHTSLYISVLNKIEGHDGLNNLLDRVQIDVCPTLCLLIPNLIHLLTFLRSTYYL